MNWMHISEQVLNLSIDYLTDASYEWHKDRVSLPDDLQHRLTELHKALGDALTVEPNKIELFNTITDNPTERKLKED